MNKPLRRFDTKQIVKVPKETNESGEGLIVGYEDADQLRSQASSVKTKAKDWVYYLQFNGQGPAFNVSEEELLEWQKC